MLEWLNEKMKKIDEELAVSIGVYGLNTTGLIGFYNQLKVNYKFFRQNLNLQLMQILAIFNGLINILGSATYVFLNEWVIFWVQLISGFIFILGGIISYVKPSYSRLGQWIFFLSALIFLAVNVSLSLLTGAQMYFIALSLIAITSAVKKFDIIIQPVIITISIILIYAYNFFVVMGLPFEQLNFPFHFSLSYNEQTGIIMNYQVSQQAGFAFSIAEILSNSLGVQIIVTIMGWIIVGLYWSAQDEIEKLLHKALPVSVVKEIRDKGQYQSKVFDKIAIMFVDFVGFTQKSSTMHPTETLRILNKYFLAFEKICHKYGVEKIKTLGDGYMAVAGAPTPTKDPADLMMKVALDIVDWMRTNQPSNSVDEWKVRIGIHIGTVVAGNCRQ